VRITFGFLGCPECKHEISHSSTQVGAALLPWKQLKGKVEAMALQRLQVEPLARDAKALELVKSKYGDSQLAYALDRFAFYPCSKCKNPYYGGLRECAVGLEAEAGPAGAAPAAAPAAAPGAEAGAAAPALASQDLLCPGCRTPPPGVTICARHGPAEMEWKCRYCCR
jgi:E3 ubiquitin-protein ligase MYCBP2